MSGFANACDILTLLSELCYFRGVVIFGTLQYSLFPCLTSTGRLGGEGVRQWTLVWGIFGLKQTDAFS